MGVAAIAGALIGRPAELPSETRILYPDLGNVRWRRGGLAVRIAGWCLGQRSVAAITLWDTVWLAPDTPWSHELLLHELRHVHQFQESAAFPLRYLWETLRRGYLANRFEVDARAYAARRVRQSHRSTLTG